MIQLQPGCNVTKHDGSYFNIMRHESVSFKIRQGIIWTKQVNICVSVTVCFALILCKGYKDDIYPYKLNLQCVKVEKACV